MCQKNNSLPSIEQPVPLHIEYSVQPHTPSRARAPKPLSSAQIPHFPAQVRTFEAQVGTFLAQVRTALAQVTAIPEQVDTFFGASQSFFGAGVKKDCQPAPQILILGLLTAQVPPQKIHLLQKQTILLQKSVDLRQKKHRPAPMNTLPLKPRPGTGTVMLKCGVEGEITGTETAKSVRKTGLGRIGDGDGKWR